MCLPKACSNNPLKQCTSDDHCKEYLDDQTNILEGRGLVGEEASIGLGGRGPDLTVTSEGTCVDVCCQITDLLNQKEMMGACDQVRSACYNVEEVDMDCDAGEGCDKKTVKILNPENPNCMVFRGKGATCDWFKEESGWFDEDEKKTRVLFPDLTEHLLSKSCTNKPSVPCSNDFDCNFSETTDTSSNATGYCESNHNYMCCRGTVYSPSAYGLSFRSLLTINLISLNFTMSNILRLFKSEQLCTHFPTKPISSLHQQPSSD